MSIKHTFSGVLFASALALGASTASAAVLDFTRAGGLGVLPSPILNGVTYTITAFGGTLTTNNPFDGAPDPVNSFGLALERDGYGVMSSDEDIDDDEITNTLSTLESITITFSKPVRIIGFAFLDLFENFVRGVGDGTGESGIMTTDSGSAFALWTETDGQPGQSGYSERTGLSFVTRSVTFTASDINDASGVADGALAAIEVATVPVPAAGLLLLGGLGGLAALRRRKSA